MQGHGIGRRLVDESIRSIGREHDIYLHVVSYNRSTIRFYERQGFVATGRDTTETDATGSTIPEFEMVRTSDGSRSPTS